MKKLIQTLFACGLALTLPTVVFAASNPSMEDQSEQAMIAPPSSAQRGEDQDTWGMANNSSRSYGQDAFTVVIDPGHQGPSVDMSAQEPMAPGSSQTKARATSGTQGNYSQVPEYEVNLQVSLLLRQELENRGYKVIMTRTDNETAISNKERAELATREQADITVRIHANSDTDPSAAGALTMAPTAANPYLSGDVIEKSNTLSTCVLNHYCAATGLLSRGIISADQMTGTNWSTVPVTILEMGFMSNQNDDLYITNTQNHSVMAVGIADGIDEYFSITAPQTTGKGTHLSDLTEKLKTLCTDALKENGNNWAVAVMDPATDDYSTLHADQAMESAGLIKLFIMGTVFEDIVFKDSPEIPCEDYETELKPLLTKMIAENDTSSSEQLMLLLGNNDFEQGVETVNQFCRDNGFTSTEMGTERLAQNSTSGNFTSASDCCRILTEIYRKTLVNQQASEEMLSILQQQTAKDKLLKGLPSTVKTASMAGYMTADQNPIQVENDAAIIMDQKKPYVVCVLTSYLQDNQKAKDTIQNISSEIYAYMTKTE